MLIAPLAMGDRMSLRILVADDSPFWREELRNLLENRTGWTVFGANDGSEAIKKSCWVHPDAIILDLCMPVLDGLGAARELKRVMPQVPTVIITADKTPFLEASARQVGVLAVFSKMECLELRKWLERRFQTVAA